MKKKLVFRRSRQEPTLVKIFSLVPVPGTCYTPIEGHATRVSTAGNFLRRADRLLVGSGRCEVPSLLQPRHRHKRMPR